MRRKESDVGFSQGKDLKPIRMSCEVDYKVFSPADIQLQRVRRFQTIRSDLKRGKCDGGEGLKLMEEAVGDDEDAHGW